MINKKKIFSIMILALLCSSSIFANSALNSLEKVFGTLYWFFSSTYMVVICTIGLVIIAIQMVTNRGEPVVMKKLVSWGAAVLIIGSASFICNLFFKPSGKFQVDDLTSGKYSFESWE